MNMMDNQDDAPIAGLYHVSAGPFSPGTGGLSQNKLVGWFGWASPSPFFLGWFSILFCWSCQICCILLSAVCIIVGISGNPEWRLLIAVIIMVHRFGGWPDQISCGSLLSDFVLLREISFLPLHTQSRWDPHFNHSSNCATGITTIFLTFPTYPGLDFHYFSPLKAAVKTTAACGWMPGPGWCLPRACRSWPGETNKATRSIGCWLVVWKIFYVFPFSWE